MFLSPHHFRQWDRFTHSSLQFRVEAISHFCWGITELEINREALLNWQFSIVSCRGVFPGGTSFKSVTATVPHRRLCCGTQSLPPFKQ